MPHTVIRMGAAHWDITIPTSGKPLHFDFRQMTKDQKRKFHAEFMSAYRQMAHRRRQEAA